MHNQPIAFEGPLGNANAMTADVLNHAASSPSASKRKVEEDETSIDTAQDGSKQKRSRGRPRLDTKDETAADRRRTQIRLAQRAYRHRKDTTITTLEDRVRDLENINAEMCREFHRFYEIVLSEGLMDPTTEAVHRLKSVTESFMRASGENAELSGYMSPEDERSSHDRQQTQQPQQGVKMSPRSSSQRSPVPAVPQTNGQIAGVTELPPSACSESTHDTQTMEPASYEVVTRANRGNASFPHMNGMIAPQNQQALMHSIPAGYPYASMSGPMTFSYQETTFARRLSRRTTESAWALATMPSPPPEKISAAFGFCLMFETKDQIADRLASKLQTPDFVNDQTWKPEHIGPVADRVEQQMRSLFVNYRTEFLDSDGVEQYLQCLGVHIPGQMEFVEAAVDMNDLKDQLEAPLTPTHSQQAFGDNMSQTSGSDAHMGSATTMFGPNHMQNSHMQSGMHGTINSSVASLMYPQDAGTMLAAPAWTKPKYSINVGVLVEEIVSHSLCLGHKPGVRVRDVNRALRIAAGIATM